MQKLQKNIILASKTQKRKYLLTGDVKKYCHQNKLLAPFVYLLINPLVCVLLTYICPSSSQYLQLGIYKWFVAYVI